jgi:hypothetical protein
MRLRTARSLMPRMRAAYGTEYRLVPMGAVLGPLVPMGAVLGPLVPMGAVLGPLVPDALPQDG